MWCLLLKIPCFETVLSNLQQHCVVVFYRNNYCSMQVTDALHFIWGYLSVLAAQLYGCQCRSSILVQYWNISKSIWMNFHKMLCRYSWSSEGESYRLLWPPEIISLSWLLLVFLQGFHRMNPCPLTLCLGHLLILHFERRHTRARHEMCLNIVNKSAHGQIASHPQCCAQV